MIMTLKKTPRYTARGFSAVAQFVEFEVGRDAGTPPQLGINEYREHAGEEERPPGPVARHAVLAYDVGHQVGRIGGEGRGDH
jgi:hypothetical protein